MLVCQSLCGTYVAVNFYCCQHHPHHRQGHPNSISLSVIDTAVVITQYSHHHEHIEKIRSISEASAYCCR
jgi:hypothetical protein